MFNDFDFQINLLDNFNQDETKAFRWLFTPIECLNHRTPLEVISDGGRDRVFQILEELKRRNIK